MPALNLARMFLLIGRIIFPAGKIALQFAMMLTVLMIVAITTVYLAEVIDNITIWYPKDDYMSPG